MGARGPGLVLLIPVIDRGIRTDLRERVFDVTHRPASPGQRLAGHRFSDLLQDCGPRSERHQRSAV